MILSIFDIPFFYLVKEDIRGSYSKPNGSPQLNNIPLEGITFNGYKDFAYIERINCAKKKKLLRLTMKA
jgi:hypothetical protein